MRPRDEDLPAQWAEVADRVRQVAAACADGNLLRVRVADAEMEIEVRRTGAASVAPRPGPTAEPETGEQGPSTNGSVARAPEPELLTADVVGVVRLSRPAVAEGTVLAGERELAYVESLGIRNPVYSRGTGRVVKVYVDDGQAVDYGQPLFAIER
jgi:acetyl-CoA carboxylase biotin carboxyl carrier protein